MSDLWEFLFCPVHGILGVLLAVGLWPMRFFLKKVVAQTKTLIYIKE